MGFKILCTVLNSFLQILVTPHIDYKIRKPVCRQTGLWLKTKEVRSTTQKFANKIAFLVNLLRHLMLLSA